MQPRIRVTRPYDRPGSPPLVSTERRAPPGSGFALVVVGGAFCTVFLTVLIVVLQWVAAS